MGGSEYLVCPGDHFCLSGLNLKVLGLVFRRILEFLYFFLYIVIKKYLPLCNNGEISQHLLGLIVAGHKLKINDNLRHDSLIRLKFELIRILS